MPFLDSLDIGNRALQYCGEDAISSVTEDSKNNKETSFAYDKVRRAELRRNVWRFAIRKAVLRPIDADTMILRPAAWVASTTYLPGEIVKDANGVLWVSIIPDNQNNGPGDNNDAWEMYFGPLTVYPYDSTQSYWSGELVYTAGTLAGSYIVYMSLQNANADVPGTATAYDATVTYHNGFVVSYSGSQWRSLIEFNLGITPADGPLPFDITAVYAAADTVTGSDHYIYSSVGSSNVGNDPVTDGGVHWTNTNVANAWSRSPTVSVSSIKWRVINATIENLLFTYPIGTGPSSQTETRNVYRLPAGYLKTAPQDPKAGSVSYLGAPSGRQYEDWNLESDYIVSRDTNPILFRFVADVTKVTQMDDMFCEGLACRIATGIVASLTQSQGKLAAIAAAYKGFMGEARIANAIEIGPVEQPIDDFIACRI